MTDPLSNNVVYFAASGDTGGKTIYPGVSPYVVSAGGTSLKLTADNFILSETGWSGSGGGISMFARPLYQDSVAGTVGTKRGVPDFSFVADPYTGVSVYDSTACTGMQGWMVFGGTSASSPALAGIIGSVGTLSGTQGKLAQLYGNPDGFNDIVGGKAGSFTAVAGWDFVTGLGSVKGLNGK